MTKHYEDHTRFSGTITNYSFDGHTSITDIAEQINSDRKFDERCRRNIEIRDRAKVIEKYFSKKGK